MEALKEFLQSWWGYTLIGSLTVGGVITIIITQVLIYIKSKVNKGDWDKMVEFYTKYKTLLEQAIAQKDKAEKELSDTKRYVEAKEEYFTVKEQYFEDVQAVTFKILSYIVMASKLDKEDKDALLKDIGGVNKDKIVSLLNNLETEFKETAKSELPLIKDTVVDKVNEMVNESQSVLDKYL